MTRSIERDYGRLNLIKGAATTHNKSQLMLPHYVIARHEAKGTELLHLALKSGEETLPVFSSEAAARDFLLSYALGQEWYVRETYAGELASLLLGLYAGVDWVLIDPLPGERAAEDTRADIAHWRSFVDYLLGSKYRVSQKPLQNLVLAVDPSETSDDLSLWCEGASS